MSGRPVVSVVVPTRGRPGALKRCLESLSRQDYPTDAFEIVVIDDGSPQPVTLPELRLRRVTRVAVARRRGGPPRRATIGLEHARGEYVAFIDDDCEASPGWLRELVGALQQHPGAGVGGPVVNDLARNPFSEASQALVSFLCEYYNANPEDARFFTSNNLAFPRAALMEAGGFDAEYQRAAAEDRELLRSLATPGPAARHRAGCAGPPLAQPHAARLLAPALLLRHGRMALLATSCQRPVQPCQGGAAGVLREPAHVAGQDARRCGPAGWRAPRPRAGGQRRRLLLRGDAAAMISPGGQNVTRTPNCSVRGSPTAVTGLNVDTGIRRIRRRCRRSCSASRLLTRLVRLNASTSPSSFDAAADAERAAHAQAQREEVAADAGVARDERRRPARRSSAAPIDAVRERPAGRALQAVHARHDVERQRRVGPAASCSPGSRG